MTSTMTTESVDVYLRDGCGRCARFRTPSCSVHRWAAPLAQLRDLLRGTGLVETVKWGSPCYTLGGKNVVMLAAFVDHCAVSFLKGAGLQDPEGVLESPGPNSRFVRFMRFRSDVDVERGRLPLGRLLDAAIALERAGGHIMVAPAAEPIPDELQQLFDADPALQAAFAALTAGRRRSHILHVGGAKQSATRARRAQGCIPAILAGRGQQER